MFRSPSIAKLAVTPPVVGSVRTETNGSLARSSLARAAETFAICISDSAPSIMRAPAGAGNDDDGLTALERHLHAPGDLLADHHAHAPADERVLHRRDHDVEAVELSRSRR